jgi:hypothetical protein
MSADQEAFEAWCSANDVAPYEMEIAEAGWQAAIAHIKQNYVLCEKKPVSMTWWDKKLYLEAK